MDMSRVEFIWCSDEINSRAGEYWSLVMDIACKNKLGRVIRCSQIMGRNETDDLAASQIFYPCMQCADIFFLKVQCGAQKGQTLCVCLGVVVFSVSTERPMMTPAFICNFGSTTRGLSSRVTITSYIKRRSLSWRPPWGGTALSKGPGERTSCFLRGTKRAHRTSS